MWELIEVNLSLDGKARHGPLPSQKITLVDSSTNYYPLALSNPHTFRIEPTVHSHQLTRCYMDTDVEKYFDPIVKMITW